MDIKKKQKLSFKKMRNLIFSLNIESSLSFLRKQNPKAYEALLWFSLCPDGFNYENMMEM